MNELSKFLVESILGEDENPIKKVVVVYGGRFQPFHKGHYGTYQYLVKKFGKDNVFISSSNKVERPKSPFNFKEKVKIMTTMFNIPKSKIVQVKMNYQPKEILSKFDEETTAYIAVVGEKDASRLGGKYFRPWKGKAEVGYRDGGYVYAVPEQGSGISGTETRNGLSVGSDEQKQNFFKNRAYGKFNATIFKMITDKLNEGVIEIPKERIEDWLINESSKIAAGQVDDGPNFFIPNYDVFQRVSAKRAAKIGYEVVNMITSKEIEDYYDHPNYPNGPVKSVSYFPAGVIGAKTPNNQVDVFSSGAYSQWFKHATRKASLIGYELVMTQRAKEQLAKEKSQSGGEARGDKELKDEFEKSLNEAITLPVEIGDTLLMGKFKNKKVVVKSIGKDEHGMPTINGKKVVTFRLMKEGKQVFFEDEKEDEKYTHVGNGNYKLKGKEKDPKSPTFKKDDNGKYTELDGGDDTSKEQPKQGTSLKQGGYKDKIEKEKEIQKKLSGPPPLPSAKKKSGPPPLPNAKKKSGPPPLPKKEPQSKVVNLKGKSSGEEIKTLELAGGGKVYGTVHGNTKMVDDIIDDVKNTIPKEKWKDIVFVGEGGSTGDSGELQFYDEMDYAAPKFKELGASMDTWDGDEMDVHNDQSKLYKRQMEKTGLNQSQVNAGNWASMIGQGEGTDSMSPDDFLDDDGKQFLQDAAKEAGFPPIKNWNKPTKQDKDTLYRLSFPEDNGDKETKVNDVQVAFNQTRDENLIQKSKELSSQGKIPIVIAGESHVDLVDTMTQKSGPPPLPNAKKKSGPPPLPKNDKQQDTPPEWLKNITKKVPSRTDAVKQSKQNALKKIKVGIKKLNHEEKKFFGKLFNNQDEVKKGFVDRLKDKAKGAGKAIKHGLQHEAHLFKSASKTIGQLASGKVKFKDLEEEQKKELKSVGVKILVTGAFAASGGVSATAAGVGKLAGMTMAELAPHVVVETILKGIGRAALFADENQEDEARLNKFAELLIEQLGETKITTEMLGNIIEKHNESINESNWKKSKLSTQHDKDFDHHLNYRLSKKFKGDFEVIGFDLYHNGKKLFTIDKRDTYNSVIRKTLWSLKESINELAGTAVRCEKCNHSWEIEREDTEKYLCHSCGWDSQQQEYDYDAFDSWAEKSGLFEAIDHEIDERGGKLRPAAILRRKAALAGKRAQIAIRKKRTMMRKKSHSKLKKIAYKMAYRQVYDEFAERLFPNTPKSDLTIQQTKVIHRNVLRKKKRVLKRARFKFLPMLRDKEAGKFGGNQNLSFDKPKETNEMSKATLNKIEKYAEKQLSPEDIEFTKHFFDRLNDPRNGKEISDAELTGFFKRLSKYKKQFKDFLEKYQQIVVKDKRHDINIPFVKQANQIIAKTIMRKDDFKTSNPTLAFEQLAKGMTLRDIAEKHGVSFEELSKEAKKGVKVEMEHTSDVKQAYDIAKDHLFEDPKYYTKLATIEEVGVGTGQSGVRMGYPSKDDLKKIEKRVQKQRSNTDSNKEYQYEPIRENINESKLLMEGGAYGHMNHPFDTEINLTFGQLKDIVNRALEGTLEYTREKTDGQALAISWRDGRLVAARNKGHLKNKGENALDIKGVSDKFQGRGGLSDAYNYAMKDLTNAIKALSDKQRDKIFKQGACFMNLEVIYPTSVNVIPYGQALLVFHGTMEYNDEGVAIGENGEAARILAGMIKQVNKDVQDNYTIQGPPVVKLPKSQDLSKKRAKYSSQISKLQKEFGLKDTDGVADYHQSWWSQWIDKNSPSTLDNKTKMGLVKRWAFFDKGFRIDKNNIKDEKTLQWAQKIDKEDQGKISKQNLMKFEQIFLGLGAEVLEFTSSALTVNPDAAVRDMKKRIDQTIKDVQKSGDPKKIEKLKLELQRLNSIGGAKKIVPNEGIVFLYNGNTFKLTGTFASVNQILGIFF